MKISTRRLNVVIKQWVRDIGGHKYQFNATYWPDNNEAVFTVSQRQPGVGKGYLEIHKWRIKDGVITGTYRRSHK
jgi:hypothetical protein